MTTEITVSDEDGIRVITIARPERRNALTTTTADELRAAIEDAPAANIRSIVLTGQGGHFSAGGDATAILEIIASREDDAPLHLMQTFHALVEAIWESPLPVIAAASGVVYGGAFNLALACDLIFASDDARFCQVFLRRGVVPDVGGAYLLPRLVGMQRAKQLMFLTDELTADEAKDMGIVNQVFATPDEAYAAATAAAARLRDTAAFPLAMTKQLMNASTDGTLQAALEREALTQAMVLRSPSATAGFSSFLEKQA